MTRPTDDLLDALLSRRGVWAALALSLLLHLPFAGAPPRSIHAWRQCNTVAVASNFAAEGMDILRPSVDRRLAGDGVTGMQFPAYEWTVAAGYLAFGERHAVERTWQWLLFAAGVLAFFGLAREALGSESAAAAGAWALAFSPDLFYFGFSALPDVLALSASLGGLLWYWRWRREGGGWRLLASLAFMTLAGLTKIQYLAAGIPVLVLSLRERRRLLAEPARLAALAAYAAVALGLSAAWYVHAVRMIESSGLRDFGIRFHGADGPLAGLRVLVHNLYSEIPETSLGYPAALLLLLGFWELRWRGWRLPGWTTALAAWGAGVAAYYLIELGQMKDHSYYLFPWLPLLFLLVGLGAAWLSRWSRPALLALLLLMPVLASVRMLPRWGSHDRGLPDAFQDPAALARLRAAAPAGARCLAGPDESGCIYLYYLGRKGWGFAADQDLPAEIGPAVLGGARYLYAGENAPVDDPKVKAWLGPKLLDADGFRVYALRRGLKP